MIVSRFIIDKNVISNEVKVLNNLLTQQRQLKKTLLSYLEKISDGIYNAIDPQDSTSLISCLDGIKKSFENIKENINQTIELKRYLENITTFNSFDSNYLESYNQKFLELFDKISEDNTFYYVFMESLLKYMNVLFPENLTQSINNHLTNEISNVISQTPNSEMIFDIDKEIENELLKQFISSDAETSITADSEFLENTLIISEKNKIAVLPYTLSELEKHFANNPEKYSSLQDIVNKEYTISLNSYKNPSYSRFKEAFNLAKNKSRLSFTESLNIANELFFNSLLNPAIITACKSIDELDIYLSCLEDGELSDFKCFNISYI